MGKNIKEMRSMHNTLGIIMSGDSPVEQQPAVKSDRAKVADEVRSRELPSRARLGRPSKDAPAEWNKERNYTTSIVFDKEQYVRLTEIAYEERLGKKETLYRLLALGIKEYEKKNSF